MVSKKIIYLAIPVFLLLIIAISALSAAKKDFSGNINPEVYDAIKNNSHARVIIIFKIPEGLFVTEAYKKNRLKTLKNNLIARLGKNKIKHEFDDSIVANLTENDTNLIENDPDIGQVILDKLAYIFLQDTAPLINASITWPVQISGVNITGTGETVCIVDTGINSSHSDLTNNIMAEYCYCSNSEGASANCCPNGLSTQNLSTDNHGHGTHVSGIVAANGGIKGIAPGSKIVLIKALNSSGSGYYSDIKLGMQWCINNATIFNISVISLSLGSGLYADYCPDDYLAATINSAIAKNISVVIATGNDYSATSISSPACVPNATAIGASTKADGIASYSNRNNITDLFAPGSSINSTSVSGRYTIASGTSMATPHAAAAFALVRQFFRLQSGRILTPQEIQNALNNTGKVIYDSSTGLNFSRIDIFSAINYLDNQLPNVTLLTPSDNALSASNLTLRCNATDIMGIKNITLKIWDIENNIYYNSTNSTSGIFTDYSVNATLPGGIYKWNCLAYDLNSNPAYASSNFTIYVGNLSVSLTSPSNAAITNKSSINFPCLSQTNSYFTLANVTFYLWNSSDSLINATAQNISGISNSTTFEINLSSEGDYRWNCLAFTNNSNYSFAESNYTITYNLITLTIVSKSQSATITAATINWTTNEQANYTLKYGTTFALSTGTKSSSNLTTSHQETISGLTSSTTYYYNITSCNSDTNCRTNGTFSFTTEQEITINQNSGGGGGGSSIIKTEPISNISNINQTNGSTIGTISGSGPLAVNQSNNQTQNNETENLIQKENQKSFSQIIASLKEIIFNPTFDIIAIILLIIIAFIATYLKRRK